MQDDKRNQTNSFDQHSDAAAQSELDDFLSVISAPGALNALTLEIEQNALLENSSDTNETVKLEAKAKSKKVGKAKKAVTPKRTTGKNIQNAISDKAQSLPSESAITTVRIRVNKKLFALTKLVHPTTSNYQTMLESILLTYLKSKFPQIDQLIQKL